MNGNEAERKLWEAINGIRSDTGSIRESLAGFTEWKRGVDGRCHECRIDIVALERKADENRERIVSGVTTRAIISSVITAVVVGVPMMLIVWDKIHAAIAKAAQ